MFRFSARRRYLVLAAVAVVSAALLVPSVIGALTTTNPVYGSSITLLGGVGAQSLFYNPVNNFLFYTTVSGNSVSLSYQNLSSFAGPFDIATFSLGSCPPIFASCPPSLSYISSDSRGNLFYVVKYATSTEQVIEQLRNSTVYAPPFPIFTAKECQSLGPRSTCSSTIEGADSAPNGNEFFDQSFPVHNGTGAVTGNGTTRVIALPFGTNFHVPLAGIKTGDAQAGQIVYMTGQVINSKVPLLYFAVYSYSTNGPWVSIIERLQISTRTLSMVWSQTSGAVGTQGTGILFGLTPSPVSSNGTSNGIEFVYRASKGPLKTDGSPSGLADATAMLGGIGSTFTSMSQCTDFAGGIPCAFANETLPHPVSYLIAFPTDGHLQTTSTGYFFFPTLPYSFGGLRTLSEDIQIYTPSTQKFSTIATEDATGLSFATGLTTDSSGNVYFISDTGSIMEVFAA